MQTIVAYYSKTGNTKIIADRIAEAIGCDSVSINLMKRGRKSKQEIEDERLIFKNAVDNCNKSDLVFLGTPTEFRKPHPRIVEFINNLTIKRVAVFCTYYGKLGATFYDMEALLLSRNISILNKLNVCVGTQDYKFSPDINRYQEKIKSEHLRKASDFAQETIKLDKPLPIRLKGICGVDCLECGYLNKSCKGAGYNCWSGRQCDLFECCVIRRSYLTCSDCNELLSCSKIKNKINFA
jgi:flavodoxin